MPKYVILGDTHLMRVPPNTRKDDFMETQSIKMQYVYDYTLNNNCAGILQVGDLFDSWRSTIEQSIYFSKMFKQFKSSFLTDIPFYAVQGNHEARYHNVDNEDSVFDLMVANDHITHTPLIETETVDIHLCDWGKEIPTPTEGKKNILVIHVGVTEKPLEFDTKGEKWYTAKDLLKESGFDYIFSGHNHKNFEVSYRKRKLINVGAMWRRTRAEAKHEPCFYTLDTDTWELEKILIPVKPFRKVYTSSPKEYTDASKKNTSLATFAHEITNNKDISLDFHSTLRVLMKEQSVEGDVAEIIYNMVKLEGEDI